MSLSRRDFLCSVGITAGAAAVVELVDGLCLIEKGKIVRPVTNFRFNGRPAVMLQNAVAMTPATRTRTNLVPAVTAPHFRFSSLSDAV